MPSVWDIQWEHPEVLWGLAALPLLGYWLWRDCLLKRRLGRRWSQVAGIVSRSALPSWWRESWRAILLLTGVALALLGFASPSLPTVTWEPAWERVAVGLLLDVSRSMGAPANPEVSSSVSRLDILKQAVQELLTHLPSGVRVGVIAFAGVPVPLVPDPTADHQAVLAKIRRLSQEFIVNPGSNLAAAIRQGLALFAEMAPDERPGAVWLMLMSDGDTGMTPELHKAIQQATLPIFTLGIGAPYPVRVPDVRSPSGFIVDQRGLPVTTVVNDALLRSIAEQTGGVYAPFTERAALVRTLRQMVAQQGRQVDQPVARPRSVRRACFLAALGCVFVYQLQTRAGGVRRARGEK
jgi:Ca-activated chloride channel family protein